MNDFTKEELEYLKLAIFERPHSVTEQMEKMRDKIKYMIDKYCEHESSTGACISIDGLKIKACKKCGEFYK